jgi:hypothetical protein
MAGAVRTAGTALLILMPTGSRAASTSAPVGFSLSDGYRVVKDWDFVNEVRDRSALEVHVRAWTEASAHAARVFPSRALPYRDLVRQAQASLTRSAAGEAISPAVRRQGRP